MEEFKDRRYYGGVKTETAVFIFAGFLDSGKTTALQGLLLKGGNPVEGKSLIICTEEGEEEYRKGYLKMLDIDVEELEDESDLTSEYLSRMNDKYSPEFVFIEFNGMWDLKKFLELPMPEGWLVANIFSLADASMYDMYLKNMRQTIMNPLSVSDVILFNRCSDEFKKGDVRRSIKLLNPRAEVFFTKPDGSVDYDLNEFMIEDENGIIKIDEDVFSQWFVDCIENTDKYYGKKVSLVGKVSRGEGLSDKQFYIGRYAVICCEADAQYIGFVAEYNGSLPQNGDWIEVCAIVEKGITEGDKAVIKLNVELLKNVEQPDIVYLYF